MIVDVVMPKMGESITEGTILEWHKKIGDKIELDEILLEIGTDKVDSEIPSPTSGILIDIIGKPNQIMNVGSVIAKIETDTDTSQQESVNLINEVSVTNSDKTYNKSLNSLKSSSPTKSHMIPPRDKIFITPVVNQIATENNISFDELLSITGTGKEGRITKVDILNYLKISTTPPRLTTESEEVKSTAKISSINKDDIVEMDHMRKLIADHMRTSIDTSAHVHVMTEVDMTNVVNYINHNGIAFHKKEGFKLTYTPFILRACIKALQITPDMNASIEGTNILYHKNINIGMAVAVEKGLMVPVLTKCENLNFLNLCRKTKDIADRARNNQLNPEELQGSTFSISNFGVFNVTMGTPIINQPNVGILGVGTIKKRPVVIENSNGDLIGIKSIMILSLGFDHRLVDGAGGSIFIETVRNNIETMNFDNLY